MKKKKTGWGSDWRCVSSVAPKECIPCKYCHKVDEMYSEIPVAGDWDGNGFVMRIGCLCDNDVWDKNDTRTEFRNYCGAVDEWNAMMSTAKTEES